MFWGIENWDVKVDRPYMLPDLVVAFALGLYNITVWHGSFVNSGPWDVFIFNWRLEQHFLAMA